jgi:peptidoglycan-associated lipoprotein
MTKDSASCGLCATTLGLLLPMFLMFGCGSTSQPERPVQVATMLEPLPNATAESQPSETTTVAEQNALAEVDEKNSIFFPLGSSTINHRERDKLRHIANLLKNNKTMHVILIGHANDNGSSSFNLAVADARVESVSKTLKKHGVRAQQIKKRVIGGEKISRACQSAECRRKMRRVELIISTAM